MSHVHSLALLPVLTTLALGQSFRYPAKAPQDLPEGAPAVSEAWFKALLADDLKTVAHLGSPFLGAKHIPRDGGKDYRFFKAFTHFARFSQSAAGSPQALREIKGAYANAPEQGEICYQAGHALLEAGQAAEAVGPLRDAVRIYPFPNARVDLAVALNSSGHPEEALSMLETLDRSFPEHRRIRYERANCLVSLKRFPEAVPILEALVDKDPGDASAHQELAYVLIELDRPAEALPHLAACAKLRPRDPGPWIERVEAHLRLNQIPEAEAALAEVARRSAPPRTLEILRHNIQVVKGQGR